MAGKGDKDRGNPVKRAKAPVWCNKCNKLRGGSCKCSPLPKHPITDTLAEACGYCTHKFAEQILVMAQGQTTKRYKCCDCGAEFEEKV